MNACGELLQLEKKFHDSSSDVITPLSPLHPGLLISVASALLLQTTDNPPETARLVRCHNPWPIEDVSFCPSDALPAVVTGIPALSSGPEL